MVTEARAKSPAKAYAPMVVFFEERISTEVKPGQPTKAYVAIESTEEGMVTDLRLLHPAKAYIPMEVVESGKCIEGNPLHPAKA